MSDPRTGLVVTHRRYVSYSHAHYAGNLVDGAYSLACFGDVATELCIRTDGDEGLFASYSDVQFKAPVRAGDGGLFAFSPGVQSRGRVGAGDALGMGGRRPGGGGRGGEIAFGAGVVGGGRRGGGAWGAGVLDPPLVATTAVGTVVVPT